MNQSKWVHGGLTLVLAAVILGGCAAGRRSSHIIEGELPSGFPGPDDFIAVEVQPEMTYRAEPEYPEVAQKAGVTGSVGIKALLDESGKVRKVQLWESSGHSELDKAGLAAGRKCRFKPAMAGGKAVAVWVAFVYHFRGE